MRLRCVSTLAQKFAKQVGGFHFVMPAPAGIEGWRGDGNEDGFRHFAGMTRWARPRPQNWRSRLRIDAIWKLWFGAEECLI